MRTHAGPVERSASPLRSVGLPDPWRATSTPVPARVATAREGGPPGHDFGRVTPGAGPVIQRYYARGEGGVEWRDGNPPPGMGPTGESHTTQEHGRGPVYDASKRRTLDEMTGEPDPKAVDVGEAHAVPDPVVMRGDADDRPSKRVRREDSNDGVAVASEDGRGLDAEGVEHAHDEDMEHFHDEDEEYVHEDEEHGHGEDVEHGHDEDVEHGHDEDMEHGHDEDVEHVHDDEEHHHSDASGEEDAPADAFPLNRLMERGRERVLTKVFARLPYSDLGGMMKVNKKSSEVGAGLTASRTVRGLPASMYQGILTAVGRTADPDATLARHDPPTREQVGTGAWSAGQASTEDVVRALGWREHTSPQGLEERAGSRTLNEFAARTREHAAVTEKLRGGSVEEMYPSTPHYPVGPSDLNRQLAAVGKHWEGALGSPLGTEKAHHPLDVEALALADRLKLKGNGQNLSVAEDRVPGAGSSEDPSKKLYTNIPADADQAHALHSGGYDLAEQDRSAWGRPEGYSRMTHGYGSSTPANRSIPFHSEMQRLRTLEPWDLGYSGNNYLACPQCAMGYHAVGTTEFRGTHGQKSASVIPQKIRENSVYLSRYLGPEAYDDLRDRPAPEIARVLDRVERATDKDSSNPVHLPDRLKKPLWGKLKDPGETKK